MTAREMTVPWCARAGGTRRLASPPVAATPDGGGAASRHRDRQRTGCHPRRADAAPTGGRSTERTARGGGCGCPRGCRLPAVLLGHHRRRRRRDGIPVLVGGGLVTTVTTDTENLPTIDYTQPATIALHLVEDNHLVTHWRVV